MLKGAGGKAFCAGGDVRALAAAKLDGPARVAAAIAYFRAEDSLVYKIANLSKPHIAIMDGIVMVRRAGGHGAVYSSADVRMCACAGRRRGAVDQRRAARGDGEVAVCDA